MRVKQDPEPASTGATEEELTAAAEPAEETEQEVLRRRAHQEVDASYQANDPLIYIGRALVYSILALTAPDPTPPGEEAEPDDS